MISPPSPLKKKVAKEVHLRLNMAYGPWPKCNGPVAKALGHGLAKAHAPSPKCIWAIGPWAMARGPGPRGQGFFETSPVSVGVGFTFYFQKKGAYEDAGEPPRLLLHWKTAPKQLTREGSKL